MRFLILKGFKLIAVGERSDTHGLCNEMFLTLKGSNKRQKYDPFRVNIDIL